MRIPDQYESVVYLIPQEADGNGYYVVLDTEKYDVRIVRQEKGKPIVLHDIADSIPGGGNVNAIRKLELIPEDNVSSINQKIIRYYRSEKDPNMDEVVFTLDENGIRWKVSDIEGIFIEASRQLEEKLRRCETYLHNADIDAEGIRFVIIGRYAELWLFRKLMMEAFSSDPFLPDPRFISEVFPDIKMLIENAANVIKTRNRSRHSVIYCYTDGEQDKEEILMKKGDELSSDGSFLADVFVLKGEKLRFKIDGRDYWFRLPDDFGPDPEFDVVNIGTELKDEQYMIMAAMSDNPGKITVLHRFEEEVI